MLFKRLIAALRSFDPFAVVLELLVLMLGVFIGVQADRWVEEQRQASDDRRNLARLAEDLDALAPVYADYIEGVEEMAEEATAALRAVEACEFPGDARGAVLATLSGHQGLPSIPSVRGTYDEMIATGALARVDAPELKKRLRGFYLEIATAEGFFESFRQGLQQASALLLPRLPFTVDADGHLAMTTLDQEALCGSVPVRSALAEVVDSRNDLLVMLRRVSERLEALRTELPSNG